MPDRRDKEKRAKAKYLPDKLKKKPGTGRADPDAPRARAIKWHLSRMDFAGRWSWKNLDPTYVPDLHNEMVGFEADTISGLRSRQKMKDIPVGAMSPDAQNRLKKIQQEDVDELTELIMPGRRRAWGILEGSLFHIVWWDPDHTVCTGKDRARVRSKE